MTSNFISIKAIEVNSVYFYTPFYSLPLLTDWHKQSACLSLLKYPVEGTKQSVHYDAENSLGYSALGRKLNLIYWKEFV